MAKDTSYITGTGPEVLRELRIRNAEKKKRLGLPENEPIKIPNNNPNLLR